MYSSLYVPMSERKVCRLLQRPDQYESQTDQRNSINHYGESPSRVSHGSPNEAAMPPGYADWYRG